jgi:S-adenosylmethionine:tRNA-ribosyltransferase-isomerase (queuine synthetase)
MSFVVICLIVSHKDNNYSWIILLLSQLSDTLMPDIQLVNNRTQVIKKTFFGSETYFQRITLKVNNSMCLPAVLW